MNHELEEKTDRIVAMLERENLDAVILNSRHNFAWLTGGGSNGVDLSRENGVASLIVTRNRQRYLLASMIEVRRILDEEISEEDFDPIDFTWQGEKADPFLVLEKARFVLDTGARIATDLLLSTGAPSIEGKISPCRYKLTPDEQERYRQLGRDASSAMDRMIHLVKEGDTELMIGEKLRHEFAAARMESIVTLVAADKRIAAYRHPVPTENRFEKTLLLVTCTKRRGLIVSLSRLICIGDPDDELKRTTDAAAYVNAVLLDATRTGSSGADLYHVAEKAYTAAGFASEINSHHQGGATGYKTREWLVHPQSKENVQDFQAFAWNPSITGTKVEETCIASTDGIEVITTSAEFPKLKTMVNGREYISHGILSI